MPLTFILNTLTATLALAHKTNTWEKKLLSNDSFFGLKTQSHSSTRHRYRQLFKTQGVTSDRIQYCTHQEHCFPSIPLGSRCCYRQRWGGTERHFPGFRGPATHARPQGLRWLGPGTAPTRAPRPRRAGPARPQGLRAAPLRPPSPRTARPARPHSGPRTHSPSPSWSPRSPRPAAEWTPGTPSQPQGPRGREGRGRGKSYAAEERRRRCHSRAGTGPTTAAPCSEAEGERAPTAAAPPAASAQPGPARPRPPPAPHTPGTAPEPRAQACGKLLWAARELPAKVPALFFLSQVESGSWSCGLALFANRRITERGRLEGTAMGQLVQTTCLSSTWHRIPCRWFLRISCEGDSTTSLGAWSSAWSPTQ